MTNSLILYELQKIHEALTKTKEEHTISFSMIISKEKFNFSDPILNTTKLGFTRLSVYNFVFNLNRMKNKILYASSVLISSSSGSSSSSNSSINISAGSTSNTKV